MDLLKSKHSNVIICKRLINTENVILLSYSQTDTRHFKTFSYMTWLQHSSVYNFSNLNSIEGLLLFALAFWSACDYDLKGRLITRLWSYRSYNSLCSQWSISGSRYYSCTDNMFHSFRWAHLYFCYFSVLHILWAKGFFFLDLWSY